MRGVNGDVRKALFLHVESFCALDLERDPNTILEQSHCATRTCREFFEVPEKETDKTYHCRCWTREGEKRADLFESHKARVAHEVHALFFWAASTMLRR